MERDRIWLLAARLQKRAARFPYSVSLTAISLAAALGTVHATEYFVATTGDDSNTGTQSAPFRHLSKGAFAAANPGDTVTVMDGLYDNEGVVGPNFGEAFVVTLTHSGVSDRPITIRAQHRGAVILDSGNITSESDTTCTGANSYFDLANASYIVIEGFTLTASCSSGFQSNGAAHDVVIRNNEIKNIGTYTLNENNGGACYGIDGIYLNPSEYNFLIDGNSWHDIGRTSTGTSGCTKEHDQGIYTFASNTTIINNVFYNLLSGWAIQLSPGVGNVLIANNTFFNTSPSTGQSGQITFWGVNNNISVVDNIFYLPPRTAFASFQYNGSGNLADHNIVYGPNTKLKGAGLASLQATNTLTGDPNFVDVSSGIFQLQPGSAAIDAGIPLSQISHDFNGVPRPQGVSTDIGAFEHSQPSACDLNRDGVVTFSDYSLAVKMALGQSPCTTNLVGAGVCNVVLIQRIANAALGGACRQGP